MKQFQFSSETETAADIVVPRQKRAMRTREALLAAVEALVAAEGAAAVTTTRIAGITGVSVGTIYRYFKDREALLLGAYDATVGRIVHVCENELVALDPSTPVPQAARLLLGLYLETAEAMPGHAGLLSAMRAIRPIEADQTGNNEITIVGDILAPFLAKFTRDGDGSAASIDPARLHFLSVLLGTLVDLYLVTPEPAERLKLRSEIEAHMLLALERAMGNASAILAAPSAIDLSK